MLFKWFLLSSITFAYNSLFIEYKSHSTIRDNNNEIMNSNNNILIKKLFCFLNCLTISMHGQWTKKRLIR